MLQTLLDSCAALGVPLTAAQAEQLCDFGAAPARAEPRHESDGHHGAAGRGEAALCRLPSRCCASCRFQAGASSTSAAGAGFPGVPLKLGEPSLDLTLLDSLGKRVTWLEATLRDMGVPAQCVCSRAEDYAAKARRAI